ncbi:MAG TPA: hypothetical protein VJP39_05205 [Gaiellaceae bacterium]|nr:hypothetical protein [Gaiellaceae bacterium]
MHKPLVLVVPLLTVALAGCGGSHRAPTAARPTPSGFVVQRAIADPLCNVGRGIRVQAPSAVNTVLASGNLLDGSTLVVLTPSDPGKPTAILHSFTRRCAPNRRFGQDGVRTVAIPAPSRPAHRLWLFVVTPERGGGAIVAGTYSNRWVVGEITSDGHMDKTFGDGGWSVLAFHGEVTTALQERSGRILLGGDDSPLGNLVVAVSPRGSLENSFGTHGRVGLLSRGPDSGVEGLALEPNGDILTEVGYGNNGCWGESLAMFTPSGRHVPRFQQRLARFWKRLNFDAFVGSVYTSHSGFTLIGTGEPDCDGYARQKVTGLIARFRPDGERVGRLIRHPSRMYGQIEAFDAGGETFSVEVPYVNRTRITLTTRRRDGSLNDSASLRTRWGGEVAKYGTTVSFSRAGPKAIVVVAQRDDRGGLHLVRVRF